MYGPYERSTTWSSCDQAFEHPLRNRATKPEVLRRRARERFIEGISVAGLIEMCYAPSPLVRNMWIVAVLVSLGSIFYHSGLLIDLYFHEHPSYEIIQMDEQVVPFPKIIMCSPSGINLTWPRERLRFPPKEKRLFAGLDAAGKEKMIEEIAGLIGNSFRYIIESSFTVNHPRYFAYHHVMMKTYQDLPGGPTAAWEGGILTSCQQTVSNCRFIGRAFNCCQNSFFLIDDDGPCFDLGMDIFNGSYDHWDFKSPISLTFDLTMDWNYVLPYSTTNGFSVHVGDAYSVFGHPVAIPAGSHSMIDVSQPIWRSDQSNCTNDPMPATEYGPYDPKGDLCRFMRYTKEVLYPLIGCRFASGAYIPNETEICLGPTALPIKMGLTSGIHEIIAPGVDKILREELFDIIHSTTECLPFCERWDYTARPSYSDLVREDYSSPVGTNENANITMTRVTVYMGSRLYISRREQDRELLYKTFILITDVFALYLGASVVTLAEILYHAVGICIVYWKTRHNRIGNGIS